MKVRVALVYSINDMAGKGVAELIREYADAERYECRNALECYILNNKVVLGGFRGEPIDFEFIDSTPDPLADAVIVLSRHSSESRRKALTVHHTGNPTARTLGGRPRKLSYSFPALTKTLIKAYRRHAEDLGLLDEYDIKLEATHHGPTDPKKPLVFIEIGSTIEEWKDPKAREAMARTVLEVIDRGEVEACKPVAGFGGSHYPIKFTELQLESDLCIGHIIPKYAFNEGVTDEVIRQSIKKTFPVEAEAGVIEKKSLKSRDRRFVEKILSLLNKEIITI